MMIGSFHYELYRTYEVCLLKNMTKTPFIGKSKIQLIVCFNIYYVPMTINFIGGYIYIYIYIMIIMDMVVYLIKS
jgi:hypothetical protein